MTNVTKRELLEMIAELAELVADTAATSESNLHAEKAATKLRKRALQKLQAANKVLK